MWLGLVVWLLGVAADQDEEGQAGRSVRANPSNWPCSAAVAAAACWALEPQAAGANLEYL